MFDLHTHILPGIDDGAKDLETSLLMLRMAAEHGTKNIALTPHVIEGEWLPDWERIVAACHRLQAAAQEHNIPLTLYPGAEIAIHYDNLERLKGPGPYCLNGGKYALVELPATHVPPFIDEFLFVLQTRGITPIIAHAERHPEIARKPELLLEWVRKGTLVQMNAPSLTGRMGEKTKAAAELLLSNNLVHVVGSDGHGLNFRRPKLDRAAQRITELVGAERAHQILIVNPKTILQGRRLDITVPEQIQSPRRSFLRNIKKRIWG
ncbi:MAG: Protein-tyrosine-phosphatase [Firmicutes bacterium]|nr:Protein-tyrosine-phosphatase [Bacillota bacterium]